MGNARSARLSIHGVVHVGGFCGFRSALDEKARFVGLVGPPCDAIAEGEGKRPGRRFVREIPRDQF